MLLFTNQHFLFRNMILESRLGSNNFNALLISRSQGSRCINPVVQLFGSSLHITVGQAPSAIAD